MNDIDILIQLLGDIVKNYCIKYCIKCICCSTNLSNAGRQKVMAKHKSHSQRELHAKRKKESYAQMEPAMKKKFCLLKQYGTSQGILQKKKSFYLTELNGINHWILKKKKSFCSNQQSGRNHLVLQKNNLLSNRAIW